MPSHDDVRVPPPSAYFLNSGSLRGLALGVGALVVLNLVNQALGAPFWTITRNIDLGSDTNAAAWFSSMLLAVAAILALDCRAMARWRGLPDGSALLLLAGLLALMSCDEIARFHELLGAAVAGQVGLADADFAKHAKWVWVLGPVVILGFGAIVLYLRRTLLRVPGSLSRFILGFVAIVGGGVVLESTINFLNHGELQWLWNLEIVVEEALEMTGSILIAGALLRWRDAVGAAADGDSAETGASKA